MIASQDGSMGEEVKSHKWVVQAKIRVPHRDKDDGYTTKEKQGEHLDFDHHTHTSILYLNDDYKGGETVINNMTMKPKKGAIIIFSN